MWARLEATERPPNPYSTQPSQKANTGRADILLQEPSRIWHVGPVCFPRRRLIAGAWELPNQLITNYFPTDPGLIYSVETSFYKQAAVEFKRKQTAAEISCNFDILGSPFLQINNIPICAHDHWSFVVIENPLEISRLLTTLTRLAAFTYQSPFSRCSSGFSGL
jgi:hypothetical protein